MNSSNQADQSLETLRDIKRMMERSSRFISLSGLSGLSAGICAVVGAGIAHFWIKEYYSFNDPSPGFREAGSSLTVRGATGRHAYMSDDGHALKWKLIGLAAAVLVAALVSSTWFTWRKARKSNLPVWDISSRKLFINMLIPLLAGGVFVLGLMVHTDWDYVAPSCLVFYGLALVNASKYTLSDIRYLGLFEIALGCINMYYLHWGLYFWTLGFGVLHIIYGLIMWWKYERA